MTPEELEEAVRTLCDESGLSNAQIADTLDALKVAYEMQAEEGDEED